MLTRNNRSTVLSVALHVYFCSHPTPTPRICICVYKLKFPYSSGNNVKVHESVSDIKKKGGCPPPPLHSSNENGLESCYMSLPVHEYSFTISFFFCWKEMVFNICLCQGELCPAKAYVTSALLKSVFIKVEVP